MPMYHASDCVPLWGLNIEAHAQLSVHLSCCISLVNLDALEIRKRLNLGEPIVLLPATHLFPDWSMMSFAYNSSHFGDSARG